MQIIPLDMEGCICHFIKWQIHPFISEGPIPEVTIKFINQDRMTFADFSVNSQLVFMKFCKHNFEKKHNSPKNFVKLCSVFQKLDHLTCDKLKL